jgi:hypothetical protein
MPLTSKQVDELHDAAKKLLELWMRTKLAFQKAFGEGTISPEHENAYLQLKSEISRIYRNIAEQLPKGLLFDGDKMMEMLKNAMTMEHLHSIPVSERHRLYASWHNVYIKLTRTLGALEIMRSGYYPHLHRERLADKEVAKK